MSVVANKVLKAVKLPSPNVVIPTHSSNSENDNDYIFVQRDNQGFVFGLPEVIYARLPKIGENI